MCVGDVKEERRHLDQSTVKQVRGRLKTVLKLKRIFALFVFFYHLHNYLKYKTLFTRQSMIFNHIFGGEGADKGVLLKFVIGRERNP